MILDDVVRLARGFWRSLTSMRTALILLLLLAIAGLMIGPAIGMLSPLRQVREMPA